MVERWSIDGTTYCPIKKSDGAFVRHTDYAALEAQLAEAERRKQELEREVTELRNSYFEERKARIALEATPPAPKVTEEMVTAGHTAMMSELFLLCQPNRGDVFSFMDDHPELIKIALTAAQESGE